MKNLFPLICSSSIFQMLLIYCSEDVVWLEQALYFWLHKLSQGLQEEIRIISVPFLLWNPSFSSSIPMMCLVLLFLRKLFLFLRKSFILGERVSHNTWKINKEMWDNASVALIVFSLPTPQTCLHLVQGKVEENLKVCVYTNMYLWISVFVWRSVK